MQRHPDQTVTLEPRESEILDLFHQIVAEDHQVPALIAAAYALSALPKPDPDFVHWLGSAIRRGESPVRTKDSPYRG